MQFLTRLNCRRCSEQLDARVAAAAAVVAETVVRPPPESHFHMEPQAAVTAVAPQTVVRPNGAVCHKPCPPKCGANCKRMCFGSRLKQAVHRQSALTPTPKSVVR